MGKEQCCAQGGEGVGSNHEPVRRGHMGRARGQDPRAVIQVGRRMSCVARHKRRPDRCGRSRGQGIKGPVKPDLPGTYQPGQNGE